MKTSFEPSHYSQLEDIAALMQQAFAVSPDANLLRRDYLRWKYFDGSNPHTISRSYVLRGEGGELLAHAAVWPVQLRLASSLRAGISFGDWVAAEQPRGVGLSLLRKLMDLSSFVLVTGGAPITRAILPRAGFVPWGERQIYARVVRPLHQALTRSDRKGWKEPLRLLRNTAWKFGARAPRLGWTATEAGPEQQLVDSAGQGIGTVQDPAYLQHMLRCPTVRFRLVALREAGELRGWSLLGFAGGQTRIADLRIAAPAGAAAAQSDWSAAVAAVADFAVRDPATCEISAYGSIPPLDAALQANGFRKRGTTPVVVYDREGTMAAQALPQLGMLEDDAASLFDPGFVYRT